MNGILGWIGQQFSGGDDASSAEPPEGAEPEDEEGKTRRSQLYQCPECGTTYVCLTMETCSSCGHTVDEVPNEDDLGMC